MNGAAETHSRNPLTRAGLGVVDAEGYEMMPYRVTVAKLADLPEIPIVCCDCSSKITLTTGATLIADACPSCEREFGQAMKEALTAFFRFYTTARSSNFRLEVGVRSVEPQPDGKE